MKFPRFIKSNQSSTSGTKAPRFVRSPRNGASGQVKRRVRSLVQRTRRTTRASFKTWDVLIP